MLQGKGLVPYHANFITYLTFYQLTTVLENNAHISYRCSSLRDIPLFTHFTARTSCPNPIQWSKGGAEHRWIHMTRHQVSLQLSAVVGLQWRQLHQGGHFQESEAGLKRPLQWEAQMLGGRRSRIGGAALHSSTSQQQGSNLRHWSLLVHSSSLPKPADWDRCPHSPTHIDRWASHGHAGQAECFQD